MHNLRLQLCRVPLVLVALVLSPLFAPAQSMTLTNGVQTYTALTNTTVTLSGRCELRLAAASNPMPGCTIHLNSPDAFFVLQSSRPSALVATYLAQVRINGAAASADNNCRVVAYGDGAVVVPHAAALQPLQAFAGPYFTGAATNFGKHVYYRSAGLGAWNAALGSFRLKRGYAVTFAEQEDGSGASRNYVAADGDLEVAVLPTALQGKVRFIYVVPWRWTSKKGIAGNIESGLNVAWKYNWNLDQNSSRDLEYVPIRQNQYWPGLSQDWQARGSSHLLGYNEPDRPDQANMSIATALGAWPDLLATGLRLGSPATSDGGRSSWLYPFLTQADATGLRVDFVPVHYYWCFNPTDPAGAANQFYNFLKATYDEVKRPLWITEWNNGANWTGCGDPTSTQQRDCIAAMIQMLEDTPWVERYALYNWVEDSRRVKWDDGSLTAAGVAYRDQPSRIAYLQTPQDNGTRSFGQYAFDGHTLDGSGYGNSGVTTGSPGFTNGVRGQALVFDGANTRVTLPPNVARNSAFTFAAWVNWQGGGDWQRIFDFGNSTTHNLFLTPRSSTGTLRFGIRNGGTTQVVETTALPQNAWRHVAITLSGANARLYLNGVLAASSTSIAATPASFSPRYNFLGRSHWPADPHFRGLLDEVLVTDYALSASEVASLLTNAPPQFTDTLIVLDAAIEGQPYTNTLAGRAADGDAADTFSFNKTVGPAWLSVASDGTLSGTPAAGDRGTNYFTVRVANPGGYSGYAVVAIPVVTTSGVWIANASANWSQTIRWSGGQIASGAGGTADFSTINITADRTVVLDSPRTLGALRFGDTSGAQSWTLAGSTVNALTLDTGSTAQPALIVTNLARLAVRLAGTNGFMKSGPGTLLLTQSNALSGVLNLDRGVDGNNHDGITRLAHPAAAQNLTAINLRNTSVSTAGGATLQLDGSLGDMFLPQPMTVTCRNNTTTPMIQNLAGSNTLAGFIGLLTGGNMFNLQSDTGVLVLAGTNQYVGSLSAGRTYNFWGAGDHLLTGPIRGATNGAPIGITKSGSGTLTLAAVNTYTNTTAVNAGTLLVNGALPASPVSVASGATLGGAGIVSLPVTLASGATLAPGAPFGTLWLNSSLVLPAGNTTRLALSRAPLTNAQLRVEGVFTRGGALVVTSLGGVLEAGDNFRLFITPNASGSFASVSLPPPGPGLGWDTRHLPTEGTVWVVRTTPPALELTVAGEGGLTLRALNGTPGWPCYVRAADDFTLPLAQWPRVATNTFDAAGEVLVPLPTLPDIPARFYTLEVP